MIRTQVLLKLAQKLLDADHQSNIGADIEELREIITEFFVTDEDVIGTENEGKTDSYHEAIRDMFFQTAEKIDDLWRETDPDNYTPLF